MTDPSSIQAALAAQLIQGAPAEAEEDADAGALFRRLVDAMPYSGDPAWTAAHRGAFVNLLASGLPNDAIAAQPDQASLGSSTAYTYVGPYSGYQAAFFGGVGATAAAAGVASAVGGTMNWNTYAVAVLTDAIRTAGASVDTQKLAGELATCDGTVRTYLSDSCAEVYQAGYPPTETVLATIKQAQQTAQVGAVLAAAVTSGQFTTNVNQALAMGGDSAYAATWFLFNIWVTLHALGVAPDPVIGTATANGLDVPAEIAEYTWWTGYTTWFPALSGADVSPAAAATMRAAMPEKAHYDDAPPNVTPPDDYPSVPNGYAASFIAWGSLANYPPPDTSCLGGATRVLMADGSARRIDEVVVGDEVRTPRGTGRVVLVESPRHGDRALWQLDDLDVFLTGGHPVRLAEPHGDGGRTASVEPWTTMDTVPTLSAGGVSQLTAGSVVAALDGSHTVQRLTRREPSSPDELVFDLDVDDGSRSCAPYYVGGPEAFVLVEAETVDALHDPHGTIAVMAAMEVALPACRSTLQDPAAELPRMLATVPLPDLAGTVVAPDARRPTLLVPDDYIVDGAWDAVASTLEAQLVIRYGPALAADAAHGWRHELADGDEEDVRVFVHEVELLPDVARGALTDLVVALRCANGAESAVRPRRPAPPGRHRHRIGGFAEVSGAGDGTLDGEVRDGGGVIGRFRVAAGADWDGRMQRPFVFGSDGVVGRITVERSSRHGSAEWVDWSNARAHARAIATGRALGAAIVAALPRQPVH